jgi:hypothetical protein
VFVDELLTAVEEGAPPRGRYDETRGYSLLGERPLVLADDVWSTGTETRVGNEPADPDAWAATTTMTKVDQESDDRD